MSLSLSSLVFLGGLLGSKGSVAVSASYVARMDFDGLTVTSSYLPKALGGAFGTPVLIVNALSSTLDFDGLTVGTLNGAEFTGAFGTPWLSSPLASEGQTFDALATTATYTPDVIDSVWGAALVGACPVVASGQTFDALEVSANYTPAAIDSVWGQALTAQ